MKSIPSNKSTQINLNKINAAIDFIEQNLENDLSLKKVAKEAYLSPFHFHRIFATINKETLHEFVVRKRIEKVAALLLKEKKASIRELSVKYGFDNPTTFSRAFKSYYGLSATQLKGLSKNRFNRIVKQKNNRGEASISLEKYIDNLEEIRAWLKLKGDINFTQIPEQKLAYIRNRGSFDSVYGTFEKLRIWADSKGLLNEKGIEWLMVIHDNPAITEESKMIQSAGLKLKKDLVTSGEIGTMVIPKGSFLRGKFEIEDHEFKKAWDSMSIWMLDNDYTSRDGHFFEVFQGNSLFETGQKHRVDICIPVR